MAPANPRGSNTSSGNDAGLRGRLEQFGLATILTFLDLERRSGELLLVGETGVGRLWLRAGARRLGPHRGLAPRESRRDLRAADVGARPVRVHASQPRDRRRRDQRPDHVAAGGSRPPRRRSRRLRFRCSRYRSAPLRSVHFGGGGGRGSGTSSAFGARLGIVGRNDRCGRLTSGRGGPRGPRPAALALNLGSATPMSVGRDVRWNDGLDGSGAVL